MPELVKAHLVEAIFAKAVAHVLRERVVPRRARHVRLFGEMEQVLAIGLGARHRGQDSLRLGFGGQAERRGAEPRRTAKTIR